MKKPYLILIIITFLPGIAFSGIFTNYTNSDWTYYITANTQYVWSANSSSLVRFDKNTGETKVFENSDGYTSTETKVVKYDNTGNLWIVGNNGIYKYKDNQFEKITLINEKGDTIKTGTCIVIDSSNNVWVAGLNNYNWVSIFKYDGSKWKRFDKAEGLIVDYIISMFADKDNNIWFGGRTSSFKNAIGRITNDVVKMWTEADGIGPDDYGYGVYTLAKDSTGGIWAGYQAGLSYFNGSKWLYWKINTYADSGVKSGVYSICVDKLNNIWFAGGPYVTVYNWNKWTYYTKANGISVNNQFNSILCDEENVIWVAHDNGVSKFSRGKQDIWINYSTDDGLAFDMSFGLYRSTDGIIYVSSPRGISAYDGTLWKRYIVDSEPKSHWIKDITCDKNDNLWTIYSLDGNYGAFSGFSKFDGTTWTHYDADIYALPSHTLNSIIVDKDNNLWLSGDRNGLYRFTSGKGQIYQIGDGLDTARSYGTMAVDSIGNLWVSCVYYDSNKTTNANPALYYLNGNNWTKVFDYRDSNIYIGSFKSMAFDKNRSLWAIDMSYLYNYDGRKWTKYLLEKYLVSETNSLTADPAGGVWITRGSGSHSFSITSGIVKFDGSKWSYVYVREGIPYQLGQDEDTIIKVNKLIIDKKGYKWLATGYGLGVFDKNSWKTYTYNDGLPASSLNSIAINSKGEIWCATESYGISKMLRYDPYSNNDTSIDINLPADFYPNPFSDYTNLIYLVDNYSRVTLTIYNSMGLEIMKPIDELQSSGEHSFILNNSNLYSGMYFYTLAVGDKIYNGKVILIK